MYLQSEYNSLQTDIFKLIHVHFRKQLRRARRSWRRKKGGDDINEERNKLKLLNNSNSFLKSNNTRKT